MADEPPVIDDRVKYIQGRKKYNRPSGMLWSENSGTLKNGLYIPYGYEIGVNETTIEDKTLTNQFLLITDDNRQPLEFSEERIEKRERMINGRMRSYHIADKLRLSTSWNLIPSRSHSDIPEFNLTTGVSPNKSYTTDGGAGGADMLEWYDSHKGSFWVFLAYDRKGIFKGTEDPYDHLGQYNQLIEMFISDFSYSVEKRGQKFDFWNVSISLEEV
jgi:hypothetical protein